MIIPIEQVIPQPRGYLFIANGGVSCWVGAFEGDELEPIPEVHERVEVDSLSGGGTTLLIRLPDRNLEVRNVRSGKCRLRQATLDAIAR